MPERTRPHSDEAMSAADIAARDAAATYNYGPDWASQPSPLHVLAMTGAIEQRRCLEEIERSLEDLPRGAPTQTLDELREYVEAISDRRSVPAWVAPDLMTDFGTASVSAEQLTIRADHDQLQAWANRPGSRWCCSRLASLDSIAATFYRAGLLALDTQPDTVDLAADEFNAWSSDVLRTAIPTDHPVYYVSVGQFDGEPAPLAAPDPTNLREAEAIVRRPGLYPRDVWERACQTVHADVQAND
jgi:hypothetical protein